MTRFVTAYLLLRTVLWTALLYFTQSALPMDVLEHLAWGREWKIVYAHHPGLSAWINETINIVSGGSHLALSATAPIATSAAMAAVWLLARRLTDEKRAAVAALSLEGIYYFNVAAMEFNHNVLQLAACAWLVFAAHHAFATDHARRSARPWILLGAAAALSMYAKYSSALFLAALFFWSITDSTARQQWRHPGPAIAFSVFCALNVPQIAALFELEFAPFQFALDRANSAQKWTHHIAYPLRFMAAQSVAVAMAAGLCYLASDKTAAPPLNHRRFIFAAAAGPLLLALIISALFGLKLKSMWGAAMLTFIPLWLLACRPRKPRIKQWKLALFSVSALALVSAVAINVGAPFWNKRGKRIHYPAENIAQKIADEWQTRFPDAPLHYIVGKKHIASLASFYLPQRPQAVINGDWQKNNWTSREKFLKTGGAVIWTIDDGKRRQKIPPDFATKLAEKFGTTVFVFAWQTPADIPPLTLGFIFVPPMVNSVDVGR